jgi:hypothetical protein
MPLQVLLSILRWAPVSRTLPAMSFSCCHLPARVLVGHASKPAATSDWVTVAPNWITAIGTVILAGGAIFTVIYAVKAFRAQAGQVAILVQENERQAAERRRAQAASVFIGLPVRGVRLVQPSAQNAGSLPAFDAQFWYSGAGGLSDPDDLGMIMPGPVGINGRQMRYEEAVTSAILTFRDAEGVRWIRMADGTLKEQTRPTARESILATLGRSPSEPEPAERPEAPGPSGDTATP